MGSRTRDGDAAMGQGCCGTSMLSAPRAHGTLTSTLQAPALLCCQAISSLCLQTKERDYPRACPTLCSWRAGSCPPAGPELLLMQLQDPTPCSTGYNSAAVGSAPSSAPVPSQYCTSTTPVLLPGAVAGRMPSLCINKNRAHSEGTSVSLPAPAPALHDRHQQPRERSRRGRTACRHPEPCCPVRAHLNTTHTTSRCF